MEKEIEKDNIGQKVTESSNEGMYG